MKQETLLSKLYAATNSGLDIITDLCPSVDESVISNKKPFRLRSGEKTPSAYVYPPKDGSDCWHVKDYGMGEGGGYFSPIDLYMWDRGYGRDMFRIVLEELAERYGVKESLSPGVNKPLIEQRQALPEEIGKEPTVALSDGFSGIDLSVWGPGVEASHLAELGWSAVASVTVTRDGKTTVRKSTATYPIFAQRCDYIDGNGRQQQFLKVYEPCNYDKKHRFMIVGSKPVGGNYIYGLSALRKKFSERGEEKLDCVVLVSGGSDAVNALSRGFQPVWLDSETKGLSQSDYLVLLKYARRVVNIPDIDPTGIKAGIRLALAIPSIYTAWLSETDMHGLHDNRGRSCKDLKDYLRLHSGEKALKQLVYRAKTAKFWSESENKQGVKEYTLSRTSLDYFLELNGYFTLKDDLHQEPFYIHLEGIKVTPVKAKDIVSFVKQWADHQGLPKALQDKLLRSRDLPTSHAGTLRMLDGLDFSKGTATSQFFYFSNRWVEVTATDMIQHQYSESAGHYVWSRSIIGHDYRKQPEMFRVEKDEEGRYVVTLTEATPKSLLLRFVANTSRLSWRKTDEGGQELTEEEYYDEQRCLASKLANIGYLLSSYKSESSAWATLCQDSTLSESTEECNGRSGKSFYLKAIGMLLNIFPIEARTTGVVENKFLYDGVTADTDLIVIDECHKNLNFDAFFAKITGDFRAEEKGNHPFVIPFSQSPKFAFGTNYVLKRHDPSTEGRIWPQVFSDYYHVKTSLNDYRETRTIRDDFGRDLMGTEYPEDLWQADIAFMLQCVQFYLSLPVGERKIMPPMSRIERREQMATVGKDFKQWADDYLAADSGNLDRPIKAETLLSLFNNETRYQWSPKRLAQHLKAYCELSEHIHTLNPASVTGKKTDGERWLQRDESGNQKSYYYVQSKKAFDAQASTPQAEEQTLVF